MSSFDKDTTGLEVVTAAGIGGQTVLDLATGNPAHLILAGRSEPKIAPVIAEVAKTNPNIKTSFVRVDLSSLASVRQAAADIAAKADKIDVLINNAGILATGYVKTVDGIESHFGVNHVSHFLLTNLLLQSGKLARGARVLNVFSMASLIEGLREDWSFSVRYHRLGLPVIGVTDTLTGR
jgi:NAD(P)-dependent dehydrogenase (short-subunit alcohol dehydrogenase family)